jgi:exodeoxyribonuclease V
MRHYGGYIWASLAQNLGLTKSEFISLLENNLGFAPTEGQSGLFRALTEHLSKPEFDRVFVIRGYAGTGKTSIVRSLVKTLPKTSLRTVLLAPTGRAAKVLSAYAGKQAFTIHKKIYFAQSSDSGMHFAMQQNKHRNTVFIVDEASMIGGENIDSEHNLLGDLLQYVMSGHECRIILIGDGAQLPPVGMDESPALDSQYLRDHHYLKVDECRLHEVMRQRLESGILYNATQIRDQIDAGGDTFPRLVQEGFEDVRRITGMELEDALNQAYDIYGTDEVLVVTRSNKTANLYNRQIRARIRWQEDDISSGDHIMVVKNNYFWLPETSGPGFIANGDTMEIQRLSKHYDREGFRFADAEVRLIDYPSEPEIEVRLMLNALDIEQASLPFAKQKELRLLIEHDYSDTPTKRERMALVKKDPFINALQIKFAYAVTCHKAQGGQWKCIFIDQGYLTEELLDRNYLRWLYTAVTRATERVYFVNFHPQFFEDKETI